MQPGKNNDILACDVQWQRRLSRRSEFSAGNLCASNRIGFGIEDFIDSLYTVCDARTVRDLDAEAVSCIHFQNQRSVLAIDDDVDAEVSEAGDVTTAGRRMSYLIPVRNVQPGD